MIFCIIWAVLTIKPAWDMFGRPHEQGDDRAHAALQGSAGYRVLYIWGSDWKRAKKGSIPLNEALCDDL